MPPATRRDRATREASMTARVTLAVIGHVDHGKTALVRALTGIQTDRLEEEIRRGMSITLGYAFHDYRGASIDLIDAPGHEDFIRAMVAGATGARAVLLVVSAVEGIGRQTMEHVTIAGLLGIGTGIVAVTKADLLPTERRGAVLDRIAAALDGTCLRGQPMVACSSLTGEGLDALHGQLEALAERCPGVEPLAGAFLPIDRAFAVAGTGAVVTGTLLGASFVTGEQAVLLPSGRPVGLRQIQVHGRDVAEARPGGRMAVSLRGLPAREVAAGEALCTPGIFAASPRVDARLTLSGEAGGPLRHMEQVRVSWGARQDVASVRLIGTGSLAAGQTGWAQLRFPAPVIAHAGQRGVLRRLSPAETIGGLIVLDPEAPARGKPSARAAILAAAFAGDVAVIAECLAAQGGIVTLADVARLSRRRPDEVRRRLAPAFEALDDERLAVRRTLAAARGAYLDALAEAHAREPAKPAISAGAIRDSIAGAVPRGLIAHAERRLAAAGDIRLTANLVALAGHDPLCALSDEARARLGQLEALLRDGGLTPPDASLLTDNDGQGHALLALLVACGRAVSLRNVALRQTLVYHAQALQAAHAHLRAMFPPPRQVTTGEARAALATSRKFIVPVLEYFDSQGMTSRCGDLRRILDPPPP